MSIEKLSLEEELRYTKRALEMQKKAREKAESLLEDKSRELYAKNKSLSEALQTLEQQQTQLVAQEKLASVGQLGAGLAHELNNPNAFIQNNLTTLNEYIEKLLRGIQDISDLVRDVLSRNNDPQTQDALHQLEQLREKAEYSFIKDDLEPLISESLQGTDRISSIANSLRFFANPNLSTEKTFALNECIEQALHLVTAEQSKTKICLNLTDLPEYRGLPLLFSQAIANIITNSVESEAHEILVESFIDKDRINIVIKDDGSGMNKESIERAFEPFFTLKNGNNGLGLGIAQSIIQQHQGHIHIESEQGSGCKVVISLPLVQPD